MSNTASMFVNVRCEWVYLYIEMCEMNVQLEKDSSDEDLKELTRKVISKWEVSTCWRVRWEGGWCSLAQRKERVNLLLSGEGAHLLACWSSLTFLVLAVLSCYTLQPSRKHRNHLKNVSTSNALEGKVFFQVSKGRFFSMCVHRWLL